MIKASMLVKTFKRDIFSTISHGGMLDISALDYDIDQYLETNDGYEFTMIISVPMPEYSINYIEKGPNDEVLNVECDYEDENASMTMRIKYNEHTSTMEVDGSDLILSNNAAFSVTLKQDSYSTNEWVELNKYVQTVLDTNEHFDFKRLFETRMLPKVEYEIFQY